MEFEPVWDLPIACYLFLAGLGAGSFIAASVVRRNHPGEFRSSRFGHAVALVAVIVGLVLLMTDARAGLFNPLRFMLLLGNVQSVMSWGVVFLAAFVAVACVAIVYDLRGRSAPRVLDAIGCILSVAVAAYTGVLLGVVKTFPLWNSPVLPFLFLTSALSTGFSAVLLHARLRRSREEVCVDSLERIHGFLPWIELVFAVALFFFAALSNEAGADSVGSLMAGDWAVAFWAGFVFLGLLVPIVLHAVVGRMAQGNGGSVLCRNLGIVSDAATIIGGFMLRYLIVMAALPVVFW